MPRNINLPTERVEQLEALGEKWNMTVADVVGKMIHEQIEKGELEPGVPGIRVFVDGKELGLDSEELSVRFDSKAMMADAAKLIRSAITPSKDNPLLPQPEGFGVARRGTSVKLQDTKNGGERTLAPSVAKDVADLLESASKT